MKKLYHNENCEIWLLLYSYRMSSLSLFLHMGILMALFLVFKEKDRSRKNLFLVVAVMLFGLTFFIKW